MYGSVDSSREDACRDAVGLAKAAICSGALSDSSSVCSFLEEVHGKLVELRGDASSRELDDEYSRL